MRKILSSISLAAASLALMVMPAFAETVSLDPGSKFTTLKSITVTSFISGAIRLVLIVAAIVFFFMLVIGGVRWMLSGGDKAGTEGARGQITAALIGLVVVFAAWAIIQLIKVLFGVDILTLDIPSFTP